MAISNLGVKATMPSDLMAITAYSPPHIGKLFGGEWVTVTDPGYLQCVDKKSIEAMGNQLPLDVGILNVKQLEYLAYHRSKI